MSADNGIAISEPSNHLHRPTSAKTQDISHILSKQFGEQFIREAIDPQVVQNLRVSHTGGSDQHHQAFVSKLLQVVDDRQRRLDRLNQLERSIMAAKARAMSADERLANKQQVGQVSYPELGLPAPSSHFRSCLDADLLRSNGLIGPNDLISRIPPPVPPPSGKTSRQQSQRAKTASSSSASARRSRQSVENESTHWSATSGVQFLEEESRMSEGSFRVQSAPKQTSPRRLKLEQLNQRRNLNWQEECNNDGRNEARRELANMQARVQFQPNPKFLLPMQPGGNGNLLTDKLNRNIDDVRIFVASPQKLTFSDYEIGNVYQLTLELRNVTCSLRYIRVIPPRTKYFSLSLGQFPGEGEVAPGLSCKYNVCFAPDSLRDYEDEILVETQAGSPLAVSVMAMRPRPQLNIPDELHIGHCLVNGALTVSIKLHNAGGEGKFAILRSDQWPATNLKSALQGSNSINDDSFEIRPAYFELKRDEAVPLEITFFAREVKTFTSKFVFVCDNCQVKEVSLIGEGQAASVSLLSLEGAAEPAAGESTDVNSTALVRFDDLHPYQFSQRALRVQNDTNVQLAFEWKLVKPHCSPPIVDADAVAVVQPSHRTLEPEPSFAVQPSCGLLQPGSTHDFSISFAPTSTGSFHSALHLLLLQLPLSPQELGDLPALQLECKAACVPLQVELLPAAICLPGDILVGTTVREKLSIVNTSSATINFSWDAITEESFVEVEPSTGCVLPGRQAAVHLCVTPTRPGSLDCTLHCSVQHKDEAVPLRVTANVHGPRVSVDEPDVNFGLVRVGQTVSCSVRLRNPLQLGCNWSSQLLAADTELQLIPNCGRLAPLEQQELRLTFSPQAERQLNEIFRIDVEEGESTFVSVYADIQSPSVCLLDSHALADIPDLFLHVQSSYKVQLYNQTKLTAAFRWQQPQGPGAKVCDVCVQPQEGLLQPRETLDVTVLTTPLIIGDLGDLLLACSIEGQDDPVVLKLGGQMKGISVSYHCSDQLLESISDFPETESAAERLLNFGSVPIHGVAKRLLHVRNHTSIRASYSLDVEFFKSVPPETEIVLPMQRSEISANRRKPRASLLTKTPNLADPKSKPYKHAFYDMCKLYLRGNKGAAFHCSPSSGALEPYSVTTIEVTAYTDMWGCYTDNLLLHVDSLPETAIPMQLEVTGCPVQFTMNAGSQQKEAVLRFGSRTHGSPKVTRPVRLNNKSPFAVRLDWRGYNIEENDQQILDFLVGFGREFPPLTPEGEEQLPPLRGDTPPASFRPPTGHLPDTPSSSRAATAANAHDDNPAAEVKVEDPAETELKVIEVNVRPHEGKPANAPFTVSPCQLTIPPESYDYVQVTFDPNSIDHVTELLDFKSYLLAYMSLDEQRSQVKDKVYRGQGHAADQLRLDMTGRIETPELDVDYTNDEGFEFYSAASDLLASEDAGSLQQQVSKSALATLRNLRDTPLSFSLSAQPPFAIRQPSISAVQLVPRQTCLLELQFQLRSDMLQLLQLAEQQDGMELWENGETGERTLRFSSELLLQFANGSRQTLPLTATVKFPSLTVSKEAIDFGICMVGQRREIQFTVTNFTASASLWRAEICEQSDTCEPGRTFEVQSEGGLLQANTSCLSKNKTLIRVFFLPKHAEKYTGKIVLTGCLSEQPKVVMVYGQGSYDEQHKTVYNE